MNKEQLQKIVFEALGEVSMCWSETPTGVFESTRANEIGNRIMKAFDEYSLSSPSLPSDEEIEVYVNEQPVHEMSIEYRRNLIANGAKWMRSLCSTRIAEMERELKEAKQLVFNITEFADGMKVLDGEALEVLKKTARRVLSDKPTKF